MGRRSSAVATVASGGGVGWPRLGASSGRAEEEGARATRDLLVVLLLATGGSELRLEESRRRPGSAQAATARSCGCDADGGRRDPAVGSGQRVISTTLFILRFYLHKL